jgi:crotonobetainyl-CoA:carnitine CoA-transferase CaiB-like acyl-CoA transferase
VRTTQLLPPGTTVVELGERVSTSLCGRFLQRMGASVTRVQPAGAPAGLDHFEPRIGAGEQERSATAEWLRHDKTLLDLDLSTPRGHEQLQQVLHDADVVLVAGTSQAWEDRGIPLARLREWAPQAVIGQITPWGDTGPYTGLRDGELLLQAAGGFLNLVGTSDREPVRLGGRPMQAAAGLLALDGVLIGLFRRQNTGQPARFHTSEFETVAHLEWKIASAVQSGRPRERRGNDGGGPVVVSTPDGHFACFFVPKDWPQVKEVLQDPRLEDEKFADRRRREAHLVEYTAIVQDAVRGRSKKDLYHRAQGRGIPAGYVATISDLLASQQYRSRSFFRDVDVDGIGRGALPDAPWQVFTTDSLDVEGTPA